jgi:hypothetical protein
LHASPSDLFSLPSLPDWPDLTIRPFFCAETSVGKVLERP